MGQFAYLATYDLSVFYLQVVGNLCVLKPDWKTDNPMDNAWGFFVSDDLGQCSLVEEFGYNYAAYSYDEATQDPISLTGPFGNQWVYMDFYSLIEKYP